MIAVNWVKKIAESLEIVIFRRRHVHLKQFPKVRILSDLV